MKQISILIFLLGSLVFLSVSKHPDAYTTLDHKVEQRTTKKDAFAVLRHRCNTCHATKKRVDVFTRENMDSFAPGIEEQVFIKKKMPKGRKANLSEEERTALKKWLAVALEKKEADIEFQ